MKLVCVEWLDTATCSGNWHYLDEGDSIMGCFSIGMLCKEDSNQIVLAYSRNEKGLYMETVAIPKGCIKRIRQLKLEKEVND